MTTRETEEQALDETIDETFPASDAPGNTVETGIRLAIPAPAPVVDNREASRFELRVDDQTAVLQYERRPTSLVLVHTDVPPALRGRHLGDARKHPELGPPAESAASAATPPSEE